MLTKRQKQILDFITHYNKRYGVSPALEEIKRHFRLKSVSGIHQHIEALKNKGYLNKAENQPRGIEIRKSIGLIQIPLLGLITAGQPLTIFDIDNRETIAVPKSRIPSFGNIYALKVVGDSMIEENINDGDIILVKEQSVAENGQKVVALIDGSDTTLKKFYQEKNQIRLQPANKNIEPIIIKKGREFQIQGVFVDVIKTENSIPEILENPIKESIKKYNKLPLNKIICGDAVEVMRKIPDNSVDLIFADPPYNLSKSNFNIKFIKSGGKDLNTNKGKWDEFKNDDYELFTKNWLQESFRILKNGSTIWVAGTYHSIYLVGYIMNKIGFETLNEVLWHKSDATPNISCTRFVADHENFIWARKGKRHLFNYKTMKSINGGKQMRSIWTRGKTAGGKKIHPTQKPEWLLERIILASSKPRDLIFDPFMGSGTTAVVAKRLNRCFFGTEIDKDYFEKSLERLRKVDVKNTLL
ncbi:hypothetical protein CO006_02180 [Candidatus Roizmanbacteria bacterium CG_4_8_14_3_um_filter_35_14]|nr:MAG: hypothetical protein CO006_02180 [Candidatus Roizmanbacteria bacterium CG_4_8_14_3_um_filter_35_14]